MSTASSKQGGDSAVDELFDVRNSFYLGNYQACINEAQKVRPSSVDLKLAADVFLFRSYVAQQKYNIALEEIRGAAPVELKTVRLLAEYLNNADANARSDLVAKLENELPEGSYTGNATCAVLIAKMFMYEGKLDAALRLLHPFDSLECIALKIVCLLRMNRPDVAGEELKRMQEIDEDSVLSQLASAWINITTGQDKLQEAFYTFQDLIDKYGSTPLLLNAQAACLIMQEKFKEAEAALNEASEKDSNNPDTLINLIVVSQHLKKSTEISNRYINQMKTGFPNHQWTLDLKDKERQFDRLCNEYQPSVGA